MNTIRLSTTVFEMSTSNHAKRNFLTSFLTPKKKKKRKRSYGSNQAEGLSELFFDLKLHHNNTSEQKVQKRN